MKALKITLLFSSLLYFTACSARNIGTTAIRVEPPAATAPAPIVSNQVVTFGGD